MEDASNNPGTAIARSGTSPQADSPARAGTTASGPGDVLESNVPLSRSLIWKRQRAFYAQKGLDVWTADKVPQFITNNPQIAEIYGGIVFSFLRDCREQDRGQEKPPGRDGQLRIIELGSGTGKFAFLLLRHLMSLLKDQDLPAKTVRYTMTDSSEAVVRSWQDNRLLGEFVQAGILDFVGFEAGEHANRLGSLRNTPAGPMVVIANYVFDSLPQDAFFFHDGEAEEFLITATAPDQQESTVAEMLPLSKLRLTFHSAPLARNRYAEAKWNQVLEDYRQRLAKATVLFPAAALGVIDDLSQLSDGRMLVLAADKGDVYEDTLALAQGPPAFEWHAADCFSLMTNFDAIAKVFREDDGEALLPDKHSSALHICGFLKGHGEKFPRSEKACQQAQAGMGPDDVFALLVWLNSHMDEIGIQQILSTLRLTRWDPIALMRLFPVLGRQLRKVGPERHDIREAVLRTWANHFPVSAGENVLAFDCGAILLELSFYEEAMQMFRVSQQVLGLSAPTSFNLGLCAIGLGRSTEALSFMKESCALDPGFEPASRTRARLETEANQSR